MLFLTNINLNKNELQNAVIQNLVADPQNGKPGQIYYNSQAKTLKQFDGTTWNVVGKELTPATYAALGGVIVDQDTLTVDSTGKVAVKVPTDNNFSNTLKNKLDGIEAGAEVNVIEGISVNGTELTPDANKVVDIDLSDYGTVKSIRIQATSPVQSSVNTAQTESLNTTISLADNYGDTKNPYASKTANYVLAAPNGSNGVPTFRKLVAADVPDLSSTYLSKSGGTMSGAIAMGSNEITGLATPSNDADAATKKYVDDAINGLPEPMVFKGTLGTGGTITTLPTAAVENVGWTYKVITEGTYAGQPAKLGDLFICRENSGRVVLEDGYEWTLIPSGDEPSGTVTNVATGTGLTGGPVTSSGTISIDTTYFNSNYKTKQTAVSDPAAGTTGAAEFISSISQDANGVITATKEPVTFPDYSNTYQAKGDYKTTQTAVDDPAVSGNASALEFISNITQNTNGVITPTKKKVNADSTPTENSTNLVTSGGVYAAIQQVSGGATTKKTIKNSALTASGGAWTWSISASAALGTPDITVNVYDCATGAMVVPEVVINQTTGAITITINDTNGTGTLAANTYKAVIVG